MATEQDATALRENPSKHNRKSRKTKVSLEDGGVSLKQPAKENEKTIEKPDARPKRLKIRIRKAPDDGAHGKAHKLNHPASQPSAKVESSKAEKSTSEAKPKQPRINKQKSAANGSRGEENVHGHNLPHDDDAANAAEAAPNHDESNFHESKKKKKKPKKKRAPLDRPRVAPEANADSRPQHAEVEQHLVTAEDVHEPVVSIPTAPRNYRPNQKSKPLNRPRVAPEAQSDSHPARVREGCSAPVTRAAGLGQNLEKAIEVCEVAASIPTIPRNHRLNQKSKDHLTPAP